MKTIEKPANRQKRRKDRSTGSKQRQRHQPKTQSQPIPIKPPSEPAAVPQPTLLLINHEKAVPGIHESLAQLPVSVRLGSSADVVASPGKFDGIVVATGEAELRFVRQLLIAVDVSRNQAPSPIYVILDSEFEDDAELQLYEAGAAAVFEWTRERVDVPRIIANMMKLNPAATSTNADEALENSIRHRLEAEGVVVEGQELELVCCDGFVTVAATVDTLWQRNCILDAIKGVPGVCRIIASGLDVRTQPAQGERLKSLICMAMRTYELDSGAVDVHAVGTKVVVRGSVSSHADRRRLAEIFGNLPGVSDLDNRVVVSPQLATRDSGTAARVAHVVEHYTISDVSVRVVGGVAVVEGRADSLKTAESALSAVEARPEVHRVVDKMVLRPTSAA